MTAQRIRYWYQPKASRDYLLRLAKGDNKLMRGIAQILYGTLVQGTQDEIAAGLDIKVHIPHQVWHSIGIHPREIERLGILLPGWEYYEQGNLEAGKQGVCRGFVLDNQFLYDYLRTALDHIDDDWANLIDGKQYATRRFEIPSEPKDRQYRRTARIVINWGAAKAVADDMLVKSEAMTHPRHRARAIQAIRCLASIRAQSTFRSSRKRPGFASYIPRYHQVDCGGRWYEDGGGFQSLPQRVKAALLSGTTHINSDLRSCHLAAAVALASAINGHAHITGMSSMYIDGIKASAEDKARGIFGARDLVSMASAYDRIADAADIPRSVAKRCILSIIYGAGTTKGIWRDDDGKLCSSAVTSTLMDWAEGNRRVANAAYDRLMPLLRHIETFARALEGCIAWMIDNPGWVRRSMRLRSMISIGYGHRLSNAVGTTISVLLPASANDQERQALSRRALSHILTGLEQDAIKHLVTGCQAQGVVVLSYEHDGLITDREIPAEAIEYMISESLLGNYARIDAKPFEIGTDDPLDHLVAKFSRSAQRAKHTVTESYKSSNINATSVGYTQSTKASQSYHRLLPTEAARSFAPFIIFSRPDIQSSRDKWTAKEKYPRGSKSSSISA